MPTVRDIVGPFETPAQKAAREAKVAPKKTTTKKDPGKKTK